MISPAEARYLRHTSSDILLDRYAPFCQEAFSQSESVPVVIAARNEATDLPATLIALAASDRPTRPIIVENNSEDDTALIARKMGCDVIESQAPHKMGALIEGTTSALNASTDGDVLYTDADTLVGKKWARKLMEVLDDSETPCDMPRGVSGPTIIAHGEKGYVDAARTAYASARDVSRWIKRGIPVGRGHNMGLHFDSRGQLETAYAALPPDLFVREEAAIFDLVVNLDGEVVAARGLGAAVMTRGDRFTSLKDCFGVTQGEEQRLALYSDYGVFTPYTS